MSEADAIDDAGLLVEAAAAADGVDIIVFFISALPAGGNHIKVKLLYNCLIAGAYPIEKSKRLRSPCHRSHIP